MPAENRHAEQHPSRKESAGVRVARPMLLHRAFAARLGARRFDVLRTLVVPLVAGLGVVLSLLLFSLLASEVLEGDTHSLDMQLLEAAERFRTAHPRFGVVMRDLSGLGSAVVLSFLVVATVIYLALLSARTSAVLVAASTAAGAVLIHLLLKPAFGRLRPDLAFADHAAWGMSFPSGHASMSAIVFLTLGALLANTRSRWVERVFILAMAAVATFLVGVSRVALGVHWGTDVLAGWALGAAWAAGWLLVAHRVLRAERTDRAASGGRRR
ncbi:MULTISPECIES: phosphatase PAP2 family protein [unclassified Variovorax]|uniref:phosphatase PAP2 family protein n=2 Tax=Variovorax TaxID=34072 RepID=UPI0011AFB337|nr:MULTISPECIES: phosphatase PAP2 family protein [unclassified Variovorax]